mmetsp:Transcript_29531/g.49052  ORF Transcript_29531/g.49052 Transcript_29531/m.49052 type:complete len:317 (+) Transcript_29531:126-1076(+)|eukprot:CAMPEP_0178835566 /NCGR_PEP_ID=MMETSP0746-20121128/11690_1 /TAXON_ID=913974 /ORGANISM="Nitzschia punctata, Strain CCMP561" /LENGTH=316 /DNA_ID=CAMNT_0020498139 /DNA_START=105 /DNA_END=1055 /DNA_ORIENTATION=-
MTKVKYPLGSAAGRVTGPLLLFLRFKRPLLLVVGGIVMWHIYQVSQELTTSETFSNASGGTAAPSTVPPPTAAPTQFHPAFHFRTYGDAKFQSAKNRIVREAKQTGWFQSIQAWGPEDLPVTFRQQYKEILALPRGGGYWIWKYALIEETMKTLREGDFIVYLDAGCQVNHLASRRFYEYAKAIQESDYDLLCFQMKHPEYLYTTERVFQAFDLPANDTDIRNSGQIMATVLMIQKGPHYRIWLDQVKHVMEADPWIVTDKYNKETKQLHPDFIDNRHDQSVFSVARKLSGCVAYPDESYPSGQKDKPFWASRMKK